MVVDLSSPSPNGEQLGGNATDAFEIENVTVSHNGHRAGHTTGPVDQRLSIALALVRDGYFLAPVTIRRVRKPDGRLIKTPEFHKGWKFGGSRDPMEVRDWFVRYDCSFAVVHETSGTEAVDLDPKDGGFDSWSDRALPSSIHQVCTPSGGVHLYWRRVGEGIGTNAGKIGPGVDARSVGGVTFAPGSIVLGPDDVPEQASYTGTLPPVAELDPTPDPVVRAFAEHHRAERAHDGTVTVHDYAWVVERFAEQLGRVRDHDPATMSGFSHKLLGAAMMLGRGVVLWPAELIAARLEQACADVWGNADDDDRDKITRGMRDGLARERWEIVDVPAERPAAPPDVPAEVPNRSERLRNERLDWYRADDWARRQFARERAAQDPEPGGVGLGALLAEPDVEPDYRIDQLWPSGGKVLMSAPQKAGKTTLVANLVRTLADGVPFLANPHTQWRAAGAGFAVTPLAGRRVFVLDFEMTRKQLRRTYRDLRLANPDAVHVDFMRGCRWDPRDEDVRTRWVHHLRGLDVQILVVDPIGPVLQALGLEENSPTHVGTVLTALDMLAREAGELELFVVQHTGHNGERARGASNFLGWPDAVWYLTRDEVTNTRALRAEGRDVWLPETLLDYDRSTRRLALGQGSRASARATGDAAIVADIVRETPGETLNGLKRLARDTEIGTKVQRAQDAVAVARAEGLVHVHPGPNRASHHFAGQACEAGPCPARVDPSSISSP